MRKIFVPGFTYFNAVVWKRIFTLHLRVYDWFAQFEWYSNMVTDGNGMVGNRENTWRGHVQGGKWFDCGQNSGRISDSCSQRSYDVAVAICSSQNRAIPWNTILNLSTVSLVGFNTAGQELNVEQVKIKVAVSLPLSRVHKLRITRSWSNCDKLQIRTFIHVSPKENTTTLIYIGYGVLLIYDARHSYINSDKSEIRCSSYMCHQSLCRHWDNIDIRSSQSHSDNGHQSWYLSQASQAALV